MDPEKPSDPRPVLEKLQELVPKMISSKKRRLEKDFGDASDFGIDGVVVVGSVAEKKEKPESDVDLYILAHSEGYTDAFIAALSKKLGVSVDCMGIIRTDKGETFSPQDWIELAREKGYHHTGFKEIKA